MSRLSFNAANPIIYEIYNDKESKLQYLELLNEKFPFSISIEILTNKLNDPERLENYVDRLPDLSFKIECATQCFQTMEQYDKAAKFEEYIIEKYHDTQYRHSKFQSSTYSFAMKS